MGDLEGLRFGIYTNCIHGADMLLGLFFGLGFFLEYFVPGVDNKKFFLEMIWIRFDGTETYSMLHLPSERSMYSFSVGVTCSLICVPCSPRSLTAFVFLNTQSQGSRQTVTGHVRKRSKICIA